MCVNMAVYKQIVLYHYVVKMWSVKFLLNLELSELTLFLRLSTTEDRTKWIYSSLLNQ